MSEFDPFDPYEWDEERIEKLEEISDQLAEIEFDGVRPDRRETNISATEHGEYVVTFVGADGDEVSVMIERSTVDGYVLGAFDYLEDKDASENVEESTIRSADLEPTNSDLIIPPGSKLLEWSRFIFPKKFAEGEIAYTIDDMQREYIESIAENRKWHPKWVCIRGYMSWGVCVFCWMLGGVGKRIVDAWKGVNPSSQSTQRCASSAGHVF